MEESHFYKYLSVSEEEKKLGIYLLGAGHTAVGRRIEYPLKNHPVHHYFQWSSGRKLSNYQILYIIDGEGIFESESTHKQNISKGDIFFLFPGIWHRFSPKMEIGWKEYWIEFNGKMVDNLLKEFSINPKSPVIKVGLKEALIDSFINVISQVNAESLSLQYDISSKIYQILCRVISLQKFNNIDSCDIERQIMQAKSAILENLNGNFDPQVIAKEIGLSYSLFRKAFKRYTGFSPVQYHIELRIQKAKALLITTDLASKDIAAKVGFESNNYFSRLFKQKTGISPVDFRISNSRLSRPD